MKRRVLLIGGIFLLAALAIGILTYGSPADERARTYFPGLRQARVTTETLREAVLQAVPLGSPEMQVRDYFDRTQVGKEGLSRYYPPDEKREGVVRIEYDPKTLEMVKVSYVILLQFDPKQRLREVRVREDLTGL